MNTTKSPKEASPLTSASQGDAAERAARRRAGRPLIGVGGIVFDAAEPREVLLIERGAPPSEGLWSVPGGLVERGEGLVEACRREVLEETGLEVELCPEPALLIERVLRGEEGQVAYHYLIADFFGLCRGGTLRAASDVRRARWCPFDELGALPHTRGLEAAVARAAALQRGARPDTPLLLSIDDATSGG